MTPSACQRAIAVLLELPAGYVEGVEVGVFRGYMSAALLSRPDLVLWMVDPWVGMEVTDEGFSEADMAENRKGAYEITSFAARRRRVVESNSLEAAVRFGRKSLDFVFLDADHSYKAVCEDIEAWAPKLRKGGLLSGHDYGNQKIPEGEEVKKAVDEAVRKNGWELRLGPQSLWFVTV